MATHALVDEESCHESHTHTHTHTQFPLEYVILSLSYITGLEEVSKGEGEG